VPAEGDERRVFYEETLPALGFEYYAGSPDEARFDSIIVDEGQDFRESWFICLESMLRGDGEFYIFADLNQNLFGSHGDCLKRMLVSKHRLTRNLRNAETISTWISPFVHDGHLSPVIRGGIPVVQHACDSAAEERKLIEKEVGRLVSQGIQPGRILILSPNRQENGCLAGVKKIKEWPLADFKNAGPNTVRFATIRSFKGLEADIVFLIGLREGTRSCTEADIYVGGSRGRYILHVFYERDNPPHSLRLR
jgi:superfamily I DNA/RNA helicase